MEIGEQDVDADQKGPRREDDEAPIDPLAAEQQEQRHDEAGADIQRATKAVRISSVEVISMKTPAILIA